MIFKNVAITKTSSEQKVAVNENYTHTAYGTSPIAAYNLNFLFPSREQKLNYNKRIISQGVIYPQKN